LVLQAHGGSIAILRELSPKPFDHDQYLSRVIDLNWLMDVSRFE
jgi:hypothetical protein